MKQLQRRYYVITEMKQLQRRYYVLHGLADQSVYTPTIIEIFEQENSWIVYTPKCKRKENERGASLTKSSEPVRGGKGTAGERQHSNFGNIELDCAKH